MSTQSPVTVSAAAPVPVADAPRSGLSRDRYLDFLRFLAICRIIIYHYYGWVWLTYAFPAMGVMFALAGSLMANSLARPGGRPVRNRLRRLLPALWVVGAITVPVMIVQAVRTGDTGSLPAPYTLLTWIVPVVSPPGTDFVFPVTEVLWYLTAYLWFVALSPLAIRVYRRLPWPTVLAPLAILAVAVVSGMEQYASNAVVRVGFDLAMYGSCWLIGFAHRDGRLAKVPQPLVLGVAAAALAGGTIWAFAHVNDDGSLDLTGIPLAQGLYCFGFVLLVMRLRPGMAWLRRRKVLNGLVTFVNARAVTIYLWHNIAIAVADALGGPLDLWRWGAWRGDQLAFLLALVLTIFMAFAVGWVEDLAARRPPRLLPTNLYADVGRGRGRHRIAPSG
jgi:peptidoglycan/LPS O-acetylase OafA/YrhL